MFIQGYNITEAIYESNNSLVYRAQRNQDQQAVIIKMLKDEYPSPSRVARFKQEYEVTQGLNLAGSIQTYSLEQTHHRWFMVLEDFGGASLAQLKLAGQLNLNAFLNLAISVTEILGDIHSHNLVHKDINLSNIVYNSETKQVKIIDFGISTALSQENSSFRNPNVLEGTLAYISPEQTGRMNRSVDYRTDFYSLGVAFYELLTGRLPFQGKDALEIIHQHIAQPPIPPHEQIDAPIVISQIILKLMAKNAEDRYQSAYGLKADLSYCLENLTNTKILSDFKLGQQDQLDRFQIPQKLYGRQAEIKTLLAGFDQMLQQGLPELILVTGYAGIGKSALVQEIYKPITAKRGYFISGKFDQLQRNIPYSTLVQALQTLIKQLLTEPEDKVSQWQEKLLQALSSNGQVMIELVPELALLIGEQPAVPELGPVESQNRFNLVFINFMKVFTQAEHPLTLFLDDLQWADEASLMLLERLLTSSDIEYLYLIGAYRDNEVQSGHPLLLTLDDLEKNEVMIHRLNLSSLIKIDVGHLIADTLHQSVQSIAPLTELVYQKTEGNPFFLTEFLRALVAQNLISFNVTVGRWEWDLDQIEQRQLTDNVVDLLTRKIKQLDEATQIILKLAACIGNRFDLKTLAIIAEKTPTIAAQQLWPALQAGLVLPLNTTYKLMELDIEGIADELEASYKFAHDRIQQATYSLIPKTERQQIHWQIGQVLLHNIPAEEHMEYIFDITNQLNQGKNFIDNEEIGNQLVQLNLKAGQKAKQANAYQSAKEYFSVGLELLAEEAWVDHYDLIFNLHKEQGETELLLGNHDKSNYILDKAHSKARSKLDKAAIDIIKIAQLAGQGQYPEALSIAIETLNMLGMNMPTLEQTELIQEATEQELALYKANMKDRQIETLAEISLMNDEVMLTCSQIVSMVIGAITLGTPQMLPLVTGKMINVTVEHGLSKYMPVIFVFHGVVEGVVLNNYDGAYRFSALGLNLYENRFTDENVRSKVYHMYAFYSVLYKHINIGVEYQRKTYRAGIDIGDLIYAGYGLAGVVRFVLPLDINQAIQDAMTALDFLKRTNDIPMVLFINLLRGFSYSLQEKTFHKNSLDFDDFSTENYLEIFGPVAPGLVAYLKRYQLLLYTILGFYDQALPLVYERKQWILAIGFSDTILGADYRLFSGLTIATLYDQVTADKQKEYLEILDDCLTGLEDLANQCEINFYHSYLILKAEKARITNQPMDAMRLYEMAVQSAREHNFTQSEAIANEQAAKIYFAHGLERIALDYLREARYAYERWGATAKVQDLEKQYPALLTARSTTTLSTSPTKTTFFTTTDTARTDETTSGRLDLGSVMKATQAISGEIVLSHLLEKMMRIVVENAGAQRGLLILQKDDRWVLQAKLEINPEVIELLQSVPIEQIGGYSQDPELSVSIANYVIRAQESVVLTDASTSERFTRGAYIKKVRPKSVLCMPLINQGRTSGILYLENNLSKGAFTPERLQILELLSSQMAVSLDNAVMYDDLEQYRDRLRVLVDARTSRLELAASLGEQLNAILDRDELLVAVVNGVKDNFSYYHAHIYLLDQTKEWLQMMAGTGPAGKMMKERNHQIAWTAKTSIVAQSARSGKVISVENVRTDPNWLPNELLPETRSEMAVPIMVEGNVVGVLDVQSEHVAGLDEGDANLLRSLASQVGVALTNADLFGQAERRATALVNANVEIEQKNERLSQTLNELQDTQAQLIEAEKMASLGGLVAGVAHEINTPLGISFTAATTLENKTQSVSDLYKQGKLKGSALKSYFKTALSSTTLIYKNLQRAGDLVQSFKQVAVDQSNLEQRIFSVKEYIDDIIISLNPKLKQTSHLLTVHGDETIKIKSFPGAFSQIITNLVMNSLTHAYNKGEAGKLVFDISHHNDQIQVMYQDDGQGIPPENMGKIFEPFFTTGRMKGGTGLGLHIVYNLITQKLGGTIQCKSEVGVGTTFILKLPQHLEDKE